MLAAGASLRAIGAGAAPSLCPVNSPPHTSPFTYRAVTTHQWAQRWAYHPPGSSRSSLLAGLSPRSSACGEQAGLPNRLHAGCRSCILTKRRCGSRMRMSTHIAMCCPAARSGLDPLSPPPAPLSSPAQDAAVVAAHSGPDQHRRAARGSAGSFGAGPLGRDLPVGHATASALAGWCSGRHRFTVLVPLKAKDAATVRQAFSHELRNLPAQLRLSFTVLPHFWHLVVHLFTKQTKMRVYFAHPHSPWKRGTNENTNGLPHQFFPNGTRFTRLSRAEIKRVQAVFNDRPRKILNWHSPAHAFNQLFR